MKNLKEFDVIGYKIKLKAEVESGSDEISAPNVVELVNREASRIQQKNPGLENGQIATLAALKIASDILRMEKDFRESVYNLQGSANQALGYIKGVSENITTAE